MAPHLFEAKRLVTGPGQKVAFEVMGHTAIMANRFMQGVGQAKVRAKRTRLTTPRFAPNSHVSFLPFPFLFSLFGFFERGRCRNRSPGVWIDGEFGDGAGSDRPWCVRSGSWFWGQARGDL